MGKKTLIKKRSSQKKNRMTKKNKTDIKIYGGVLPEIVAILNKLPPGNKLLKRCLETSVCMNADESHKVIFATNLDKIDKQTLFDYLGKYKGTNYELTQMLINCCSGFLVGLEKKETDQKLFDTVSLSLDEIYFRIEDLAFDYKLEKDHILELFETVIKTLTSFLNGLTGLSVNLKDMLIELINLVFNTNRVTRMFEGPEGEEDDSYRKSIDHKKFIDEIEKMKGKAMRIFETSRVAPDDYKRFIDEIEKMNDNATGKLTWDTISRWNDASKMFDEINKSKKLNEKEKQSLLRKFQYKRLLGWVQSHMKSLIMSDLKTFCKEGYVLSAKDAEGNEQGLTVTKAMYESLEDKIWESMLPKKQYDKMIDYLNNNFKILCLGNRKKALKEAEKNRGRERVEKSASTKSGNLSV